jgi:hypothetical protein
MIREFLIAAQATDLFTPDDATKVACSSHKPRATTRVRYRKANLEELTGVETARALLRLSVSDRWGESPLYLLPSQDSTDGLINLFRFSAEEMVLGVWDFRADAAQLQYSCAIT